jgi:hypothetical protein
MMKGSVTSSYRICFAYEALSAVAKLRASVRVERNMSRKTQGWRTGRDRELVSTEWGRFDSENKETVCAPERTSVSRHEQRDVTSDKNADVGLPDSHAHRIETAERQDETCLA